MEYAYNSNNSSKLFKGKILAAVHSVWFVQLFLASQHSRPTNYLWTCLCFQRQQLRAVAVSEVAYQWKEQSSRLWVYGHDHKVYAPDYP